MAFEWLFGLGAWNLNKPIIAMFKLQFKYLEGGEDVEVFENDWHNVPKCTAQLLQVTETWSTAGR